MKKIIMLTIVMMMMSCTAEDIRIWNENTKERKERGAACGYTRSGHTVCGYTK